MILNKKQKTQIASQLKAHAHSRYMVNIKLSDGYQLKKFVVYPKIMRPEKMTSIYFGRWLFFNKNTYKEKTLLDMGCGSGILGIITALYGAKKVTFCDVDENAVKNTKENIKIFKLESKSLVFQSNLFENIKNRFDIIVFNHPFFCDISKKYKNVSMINDGSLLHKFLNEARIHLKKNGFIIMPYFHQAGLANNPMIQALRYRYKVLEVFSLVSVTGLQRGPISIYKLS